MIASPSSGQGKTSFTAALARTHIKLGRKVAIFKLGPDYLDPTIHQLACGQPVYNLDLWMMGEAHCRELLFKAAQSNDLILIESLMGLHDNQPSSAEFARLFNIPVLLLMNVAKYAQTAAAIVHGLQHYTKNPNAKPLDIYGIVGNRVGSDNHHRILLETLKGRYLGSVKRDEALRLPQRHLGLIQAQELNNLDAMLNLAADSLINSTSNSDRLLQLPEAVEYKLADTTKSVNTPAPCFKNKTIAIARDTAFSFIYPANIDYLIENSAKLEYFSPLNNEPVPDADILWLPGGYPELHLTTLANNNISKQSVIDFCQANKPVLAECGGMLYLLDSITNQQGNSAAMCGVIKGKACLKERFQGIGLQSVKINKREYRGHSFHHSNITTTLNPEYVSNKQDGAKGEAVYKTGHITASYLHFYFSYSGLQWICDNH